MFLWLIVISCELQPSVNNAPNLIRKLTRKVCCLRKQKSRNISVIWTELHIIFLISPLLGCCKGYCFHPCFIFNQSLSFQIESWVLLNFFHVGLNTFEREEI